MCKISKRKLISQNYFEKKYEVWANDAAFINNSLLYIELISLFGEIQMEPMNDIIQTTQK